MALSNSSRLRAPLLSMSAALKAVWTAERPASTTAWLTSAGSSYPSLLVSAARNRV